MQKRPSSNIRWRSKRELEKIRKAAKIVGLSLNQFVIGRMHNISDSIINNAGQQAAIIAAENLCDSDD